MGVQHHCEWLWFNSADNDTDCEQEYSDLTLTDGRQHHTPATLPKVFHEEPGHALSRLRQNMCIRLLHTPKISRKLLESGILFCCAKAAKTALGTIKLWFNYFPPSFYKALDVHFSRVVKERDAPVVVAWSPVSLSVYRDDQFANYSVPFQNVMPLDTHTSQPNHPAF